MIVFTLLDDRCYHLNTDYSKGKTLRNGFLGLSSVKQCQLVCQTTPQCQFFSFDLDNERCWLKKSDDGRVFKTDFISGKKYCEEKGENNWRIDFIVWLTLCFLIIFEK